jgi:hypothetical protein
MLDAAKTVTVAARQSHRRGWRDPERRGRKCVQKWQQNGDGASLPSIAAHLQYLAANVQSPGGHFVATYGALKLFPFWDPLRGDPRFEKIVASLAPKDSSK